MGARLRRELVWVLQDKLWQEVEMERQIAELRAQQEVLISKYDPNCPDSIAALCRVSVELQKAQEAIKHCGTEVTDFSWEEIQAIVAQDLIIAERQD